MGARRLVADAERLRKILDVILAHGLRASRSVVSLERTQPLWLVTERDWAVCVRTRSPLSLCARGLEASRECVVL